LALAACVLLDAARGEEFTFHARSRVERPPGSGRFVPVERTVRLDPKATALIVCDMWDRHWCPSATARVREMAPRMNAALEAARRRGALIIHAPSGTMDFYKNTPQRRRAQAAPPYQAKTPLRGWAGWDPGREPPLPIDDSDGGCDDPSPPKPRSVWRRQIDLIRIAPDDAISDSGSEIFGLLQSRGIRHVILMGVHLNMCVLGRPFGIRRMVLQGMDVYLMRDLTDTMYNPRRRPYISHFAGTDLMVEHVERHWCPSVTSADLLGGRPFRFQADRRPRIVFVIGENEYRTWETLPAFARRVLAWRGLRADYATSSPDPNDFHWTNWQALARADLVWLSVRRRAAPPQMLRLLRAHLEAGRPLIGIRTASHAFAPRGAAPARAKEQGLAVWEKFDPEVLGGNYHGHYKPGPTLRVTPAPRAAQSPVLKGVDLADAKAFGSLYKTSPLAKDAAPLLYGAVSGRPAEPVAWTRLYGPNRARVFYTSLGHPDDFRERWFRHLLLNAVCWALDKPPPPEYIETPWPEKVPAAP